MPWDARDTMSLRTEFVHFASQDGANIRALCRAFILRPPQPTSGSAAGWPKATRASLSVREHPIILLTERLTMSSCCCATLMSVIRCGAPAR